MNLLGHNYVAYKTLGHVSSLTLLGSHIPDFVPFLPSSVFSFEEIHENQEEFLQFVRKKYPGMSDLPLSMMCHSVKYGADEYNRKIDSWLLEDNEKLTDKLGNMIAKDSNISYETARGRRLHNYLWCGIDLFLIKNNPDGIKDKLANALNVIDYAMTAKILADFYNKDENNVEMNLKEHFKYIDSNTFRNTRAFTLFWSKFLSLLNEGDNLDVAEGTKLLEFTYKMFEPKWVDIMNKVQAKVKTKMEPYLT